MDFWIKIQNYIGIIGAVFGIAGIVIGIIGFISERRSRIGPRLAYQFHAIRIIEKEKKPALGELDILFRSEHIPRLTVTFFVIWNMGTTMLDGKNIVHDDPLMLKFKEDSKILRIRILKETRKMNKFECKISENSPNEATCNFEYLEPGDGVSIELLHTAEERYPTFQGTIKGLPNGVLNEGRIRYFLLRQTDIKVATFMMLFLGICLLIFGFLTLIIPLKIFETSKFFTGKWFNNEAGEKLFSGMFFTAIGLFFIFLVINRLRRIKRRFPKVLETEEIEEIE
jgi:hypothetical protein